MRIALIGAAFSAGGADPGCRHGPQAFYEQEFRGLKRRLPGRFRWAGMIRERSHLPLLHPAGVAGLADSSHRLAAAVARQRQGAVLPVVIGGDHSCAIGTWAGIAAGSRRPLGLLWIDAHLDSHTPETSASHRLHGMPLAVLLGEGDPELLAVGRHTPLIDPRYCAVIGVRSFERGEPERLRRLGVRFHTRHEIRRRGLGRVLNEAWRHVAAAPGGFGVSLDLDVLDPLLAPGVSVPERRGLNPRKLARLLRQQPAKHRLRGLELAELNPRRDPQGQTRRLLPMLLASLLQSR
ncbi:MAG: arginase [Moraxellaceae bacterium]|nr:arginase [Moraxellaceae bacterium]